VKNPLETLFGANWRTSLSGWAALLCGAIALKPDLVNFVPEPYRSWVVGIATLGVFVGGGSFVTNTKDKQLTGNGTLRDPYKVQQPDGSSRTLPPAVVVLLSASMLLLSSCSTVSDWVQSPTAKSVGSSVLRIVEAEALNIGLNAVEQYASKGNVSWGNAALSAAPVALRTLESTPYAAQAPAIEKTVSSWIAAPSMKAGVSAGVASVVQWAVSQGVPADSAVEAAAVGLDKAVATSSQNLGDGLAK
jgi:hypothetical protein